MERSKEQRETVLDKFFSLSLFRKSLKKILFPLCSSNSSWDLIFYKNSFNYPFTLSVVLSWLLLSWLKNNFWWLRRSPFLKENFYCLTTSFFTKSLRDWPKLVRRATYFPYTKSHSSMVMFSNKFWTFLKSSRFSKDESEDCDRRFSPYPKLFWIPKEREELEWSLRLVRVV